MVDTYLRYPLLHRHLELSDISYWTHRNYHPDIPVMSQGPASDLHRISVTKTHTTVRLLKYSDNKK